MEQVHSGICELGKLWRFSLDKLYTGVADGRIVEVDLKTLETNTIVERLGVPPCGKYHELYIENWELSWC